MGGCETLSSRSGSFVTEVLLRTEQAGVFDDDVRVAPARGAAHRLAARGVLPQLHRHLAAARLSLPRPQPSSSATSRAQPQLMVTPAPPWP